MRHEIAVMILAFAAASAPAAAQQMGVRGGAIYHDMGTMDYGMAPQENDYATARRLIHFGKYAEAITQFDVAIGIDPKLDAARSNRAEALSRQQKSN